MLGLNPNAVSIRLTRAKAALREALNPEVRS
jgi:DNA-directed RNA polymerase specialized sigma24 family protein